MSEELNERERRVVECFTSEREANNSRPAPMQVPEGYPDGFDASCGIPAEAMRAANALLADMKGIREWDVPCAAAHIAQFSAPAAPSVDAEKVSGWIPVSERRPGVGVVVLGFWKNSAGPHSHITGQNYGITARNEHGLWYDASEDDNEDDEWMRPDYWQPLPPPPAIANQEAQDGR